MKEAKKKSPLVEKLFPFKNPLSIERRGSMRVAYGSQIKRTKIISKKTRRNEIYKLLTLNFKASR
jgi:hypothetical protein